MMKQLWKWGIAVVAFFALVGAAVGIVAAQTDEGPTPSATEEKESLREDFLSRLADELGITREQLDQALTDTALGLVDEAVAEGRLTQEEAERIRERIAAGELPFFGFGHGMRHGFGPGQGFGHGPCLGRYALGEVAEFLGIEPADVREGLEGGQSLTQIAEANGKTRDELKSFLLAEVEEKVNEAVANGRSTQERADEILQNASERIDELIDREGLPAPPVKFRFAPEFAPDDEAEGAGLIL